MEKIYRDSKKNIIFSKKNFNFVQLKDKFCKFINEENKKEYYLKIKENPYTEECENCFFLNYRTKYKSFCRVKCLDTNKYIETGN